MSGPLLLHLPVRNSSENSDLPYPSSFLLPSPSPLPLLPPQVWSFEDKTLSSGSAGRYSVQTVASDHGVVSSLVLSKTLAQDFNLHYNCTAWNRFGTDTAQVTLKEQGT